MSSLEKVKNALNSLHENINSLNTDVKSMSSQLKDTKADTQNLIELTKRLQIEKYFNIFFNYSNYIYILKYLLFIINYHK